MSSLKFRLLRLTCRSTDRPSNVRKIAFLTPSVVGSEAGIELVCYQRFNSDVLVAISTADLLRRTMLRRPYSWTFDGRKKVTCSLS